MASTHLIDGNIIALNRYLHEQEKAEAQEEQWSEFIGRVKSDISNIIDNMEDYDITDLKGMSDKLDKAIADLGELIGKLEGER